MTSVNQDVGFGDNPYFEGDSLEMTVTVREQNNRKDLSGATVEWVLYDDEQDPTQTILDDGDAGVIANVTNASEGEVTITINAGITDGEVGQYEHELRVTDSNGDKKVVTIGRFHISVRQT